MLPEQAQLRLKGERLELNAAETSVVGAAAGAVTALLTTPLDVVKTRLMTQGASARYAGIGDCVRKIAQQEGLGTFFTARNLLTPFRYSMQRSNCALIPLMRVCMDSRIADVCRCIADDAQR